MPAGGLVVAGAVAAGTLIYGAIKEKKAKAAQAALLASRPKYQIPQEEQDIENLAESRANMGMSGASRQQLQNNTDRSLATSTNAALMGGADPNTIGNIAEKSQEGYDQNAIYDDQVRLQNLNNLQTAYARMSANKDKAWSINNNQPWKDQAAAASQQVQAANNIEMSGISQLGSAASGAGKYFGGGAGGGMSRGGGSFGGGGYIDSLPSSGPSMMPTPQSQPGMMQTSSLGDWGIG